MIKKEVIKVVSDVAKATAATAAKTAKDTAKGVAKRAGDAAMATASATKNAVSTTKDITLSLAENAPTPGSGGDPTDPATFMEDVFNKIQSAMGLFLMVCPGLKAFGTRFLGPKTFSRVNQNVANSVFKTFKQQLYSGPGQKRKQGLGFDLKVPNGLTPKPKMTKR